MRLKFMQGDGYRMIEVDEYSFSRTPVPTIHFKNANTHESVQLVGTVYVTNERGDTIDKLTGDK